MVNPLKLFDDSTQAICQLSFILIICDLIRVEQVLLDSLKEATTCDPKVDSSV